MGKARVLLIANPKSRRGGDILAESRRELGAAGLAVRAIALEAPDDLPDIIRSNAAEADVVAIAGGDGTMHCAADAVRQCGRPLGIIPAGTANDLARTLGIPNDTAAACRVIGAMHLRPVDLGLLDGRPFFNVAHIGFGVAVAEHHSDSRKKRFGVAAYLLSIRDALAAYRPFECEIVCDGQEERRRLVQLAVGNGRHYGGGLTVSENASISDGRLDLYAVPPLPWWRVALLLPRLKLGPRRQDPGVLLRNGTEITIRTHPVLPINTDGEITAETPACFTIQPAAVQICVPADSWPSGEGHRHAA